MDKKIVVLWFTTSLALLFFSIAHPHYLITADAPEWISSRGSPRCPRWDYSIVSLYNASVVHTVDQRGCGMFSTVQKEVNALPELNNSWMFILVDSGVYREKVVISSNKKNLIIQGVGYQTTSIEWNDTSNSSGGMSNSASVRIMAPSFRAYNISFVNSAPAPNPGDLGGQAVALKVSGDQSAFYRCGFFGAQDTLYDDKGRHYYKDCLIQGSIDFIFGSGRSLFEDCTIKSIAKDASPGGISGTIAANKRESAKENTAYSFVKCNILGSGRVLLGRAWGAYAVTVFSKSNMSNVVAEAGWSDMNNRSGYQNVYFGEYECYGPGADMTHRVPYAKKLSQFEAAPFLNISFVDGQEWLVGDM